MEPQLPVEKIVEMTLSVAGAQTTASFSSTPLPTAIFAPTITPQPMAIPFYSETPTQTLLFNTPLPVYQTNTPFILPSPVLPTSGGSGFDNNGDGKVTCADFSTQAAAQQACNAGYTNLDGNDNDGKACESLPWLTFQLF